MQDYSAEGWKESPTCKVAFLGGVFSLGRGTKVYFFFFFFYLFMHRIFRGLLKTVKECVHALTVCRKMKQSA